MRTSNVAHRKAGSSHCVALISGLVLLATVAGCTSPTTYDDPATLTLVSGGSQTVTINPGGLADLPEPVVVRLDRNGKLLGYSSLSVEVASTGSSAPPRYYFFITDANGTASMPLQADDTPGPFNIDVSFWICSGKSFCSESKTLATLRVTGTAVN